MLLIGGDPNYLRRRVRRARYAIWDEGGDPYTDLRYLDWLAIRDMLEYIGHVENPNRPGAPPDHWYRCRNQDVATGDCTIYPTRPQMCRDYPTASVGCTNAGCTFQRDA